ncbi:MAG: ATP-binding protein [Aggregatilineales bacterium]
MSVERILPIHEKICRWINANHRQDNTELLLVSMAVCNLSALETIANGTAINKSIHYDGYQEFPCDEFATFIRYIEGKPVHRTGALKFTFSPAEGAEDQTGFEVLVVGAWVSDDDINNDMVVIAEVPKARIDDWLDFEDLTRRAASSAMAFRQKVYIVGGTSISFDATTEWDDIYLPPDLKQGILKDIDAFFTKGVNIYQRLKINPFRKLLFAGVPGTGKTMLCSAIAKWALERDYFVVYVSGANQHGAKFWKIHQALRMAESSDTPTIVIVEELDAYLDDDSKAQLLNVLDGSETPNNMHGTILLATTNHPEIIDDRVMKRPGRLDRVFIVPELDDSDVAEKMLREYLGVDWQEDHQEIVPKLVGRPGAFIREVALHALTMAAYQDENGLPPELLRESLDTLLTQIEAKDDFLTARKQRPIGLTTRINGNR